MLALNCAPAVALKNKTKNPHARLRRHQTNFPLGIMADCTGVHSRTEKGLPASHCAFEVRTGKDSIDWEKTARWELADIAHLHFGRPVCSITTLLQGRAKVFNTKLLSCQELF